MLDKAKKDRIIKKHQTHEGDTGSPQVQIAILTEEVKELQGHLQLHKKDHSSRRGLLRKVNQRRKLLNYLYREDEEAYEEIIKALKLKKQLSRLLKIHTKPPEETEETSSTTPAVENSKATSKDGIKEE